MAKSKGYHLISSEKSLVLSLHEFFEKEKESGVLLLDQPVERVVAATGLSRSTVYNITKEKRETGHVTSPKKRGRKEHSGKVKEYTDNFLEGVIRRKIHRFYTDKIYPTMFSLHAALVEEAEYPFSKTTLYKTVHEMGFRYRKMDKKKALYEQHKIIASRASYLEKIKRCKEAKRPIIYLDKTWLNQRHTLEKCWLDYDGLGGLRIPSGKGKRLIVLHAGWEKGWILEAELVFVGEKDSGDYHKEMNIHILFYGMV